MNVHKLCPPARKHRYDENAKDFSREALINLFDGIQRFNGISHLVDREEVKSIELALYTACLYVAYSHPRATKAKRERRFMSLSASNTAGGEM
jgi:hypothetical protein